MRQADLANEHFFAVMNEFGQRLAGYLYLSLYMVSLIIIIVLIQSFILMVITYNDEMP